MWKDAWGEDNKVRNRDYVFYRYVDDGFLYFNVREDRNRFSLCIDLS